MRATPLGGTALEEDDAMVAHPVGTARPGGGSARGGRSGGLGRGWAGANADAAAVVLVVLVVELAT